MAKPDRSDVTWNEVDVAALPAGLIVHYEHYKELQREAAIAREAFEAAFSEMAPAPRGSRWGFGYRFGKLSVAALPDDAKPAKRSAPRALDMTALLALSGGPRSL
jgi:hypothetical protein